MDFDTMETLVSNTRCLCCSGILKAIASIESEKKSHTIRVGCCSTCGFVSYIDKPSHAWIIDFYTSTWNTEEGVQDFVKKDLSSTTFTEILNKLGVSHNALICEIGTGRGGNFAALKNNGYTNLVGVENSSHRAHMIAKMMDVPIYHGGFEQDNVQDSLRKHGNYDVIYTAHVFEHVYDPEKSIELCSKLQTHGGRLIIAVPHFVGEPAMGVLSFLPHLHSFTEISLTELLRRNGYTITDTSYVTKTEILLIAEKKDTKAPSSITKKDYPFEALQKLEKELLIEQIPPKSSALYLFSRKNCVDTKLIALSSIKIIRFLQERYYTLLKHKKGYRSIVISKSSSDESSNLLSLVWKDRLTMFYK
jgi:2-polyprenyl-3-methyl-5-hydroxy-6-metoxy-1,4-benzoquinol methylase